MYKRFSVVFALVLALALGHATIVSAASEASHLRMPRDLAKAKGNDCYDCDGNDPCGKDDNGYYKHCSKHKFVQCSNGACYEQNCAPGTVWDQDKLTCDFPRMNSKSPCGECEENPCTKKNIKAKKFYHPHCNSSNKYLQCGAGVGMCYEMRCAPGTMWDQDAQVCVMKKKH